MFADRQDPRERALSLVLVAAIHAGLGYALFVGLGIDLPRTVSDSLKTFAVLPPPVAKPPAPRPKAPSRRAPRKEGAASPANMAATATPIVAPPPVIVLPPPPPPVVVARKASTGTADHSGNAPVPGPGTGSGGIGAGTGSGRYGNGPGGGGDGEMFELVSRGVRDGDFPRGMPEDGRAHRVRTKIIIGIDGRVANCAVIGASDSAVLDASICGVLRRRLRFRPSRDAAGRPFADYAFWEHTWNSGTYGSDDDD